MALAGGVGARLLSNVRGHVDSEIENHAASLFGETQGRFVVTERLDRHAVEKYARDQRCRLLLQRLGRQADDIAIERADGTSISQAPLADLRAAHEGFFPKLMGSELTPEF